MLTPQINPDPTACDPYTTEATCLATMSAADPSLTECLWDAETQVCALNEDALASVVALVLITFVCTIIAIPPLMFIEWLVCDIIQSPTKGAAAPPPPRAHERLERMLTAESVDGDKQLMELAMQAPATPRPFEGEPSGETAPRAFGFEGVGADAPPKQREDAPGSVTQRVSVVQG
jgi:hypothetical protein